MMHGLPPFSTGLEKMKPSERIWSPPISSEHSGRKSTRQQTPHPRRTRAKKKCLPHSQRSVPNGPGVFRVESDHQKLLNTYVHQGCFYMKHLPPEQRVIEINCLLSDKRSMPISNYPTVFLRAKLGQPRYCYRRLHDSCTKKSYPLRIHTQYS